MKIIAKYTTQLVKESSKKYELETKRITEPYVAIEMFQKVFNLETQTREIFVMLALNTKNEVIGAFEVFTGSINASLVHPRDIFQRLLLVNAQSFIVAHNHPSGDPTPSREDKVVTERLHEASKIMGLDFLDHMIIGDNGRYTSLREEGVFN